MARKEEELLLSVADVVLIDNKTKLEYATASLKSHNISQTVDTSEIRAGRKNAVVATLESNKTITVEIEDVHSNRDWIAIAMDAELQAKTNVVVRVLPQKLKVQADFSIKLSKEPQDIKDIQIMHNGVKLSAPTQDTTDKTKLILTGVEKGDIVEVMSYPHVAKAADVMAIGGEGVGRSFAMYMEESVFNNDMEIIATKTTYFPRVVPESSFSMEGSSELAEQNMTYTFTVALAEAEDALGYIYYVEETKSSAAAATEE